MNRPPVSTPGSRPAPTQTETVENSEASLTISRLATLLANGVRVSPGEAFPNGWDDSAEGRRRRYAQAQAQQIRAARRLLTAEPAADELNTGE